MMRKGDRLLINDAGNKYLGVVSAVYESGNVRVRRPDGHLVIVPPDMIERNYGTEF